MDITYEMLDLIKFGACCGCFSLLLWFGFAMDKFLDWSIGKKNEREIIERRLSALEDLNNGN